MKALTRKDLPVGTRGIYFWGEEDWYGKYCYVVKRPKKGYFHTDQYNRALWVSMWPKAEYVKHAWPESWFCQIFRNEGSTLSSKLIKEAVGLTLTQWYYIPRDGFITFIDPNKVRHKRDPGRCFRKAGFEHVGYTQGGLVVLQLRSENFPLPRH